MSGGQVMVVIIVAIVMIASVIRAKYAGRSSADVAPEDRAETLRLREQVEKLQERIKVLERITVEKENSLSKQIEELSDR